MPPQVWKTTPVNHSLISSLSAEAAMLPLGRMLKPGRTAAKIQGTHTHTNFIKISYFFKFPSDEVVYIVYLGHAHVLCKTALLSLSMLKRVLACSFNLHSGTG